MIFSCKFVIPMAHLLDEFDHIRTLKSKWCLGGCQQFGVLRYFFCMDDDTLNSGYHKPKHKFIGIKNP